MNIWNVYIWIKTIDYEGWCCWAHDLPHKMAINMQQDLEYIDGQPARICVKYSVPVN